jgi:hypothetical protein
MLREEAGGALGKGGFSSDWTVASYLIISHLIAAYADSTTAAVTATANRPRAKFFTSITLKNRPCGLIIENC